MPLRLATYKDLPAIAHVFTQAFYDEELNDYFFPYRKQYPDDYIRAYYHVLLERWWGYTNLFVVSYDTPESGSTLPNDEVLTGPNGQKITGVAQWSRVGLGSEKLWGIGGWWDLRRYIQPLVSLALRIHRALIPNRAARMPTTEDPQPMQKWLFGSTVYPFIQQYFSCRPDHWSLELLGVLPIYHGRGIATKLVQEGLDRAREEQLPSVVIMAAGLEDFYRRLGFVDFVGYAYEPDLTETKVDEDGKERQIIKEVNPLRRRGIGGGGIAWTESNS
ncbi:hypothetical protein LTR05_000603 [Lithohypha guttulata]|uniref:N-acetyltransferase domain-containing protein n=1 Tax=Lithohypha guttulata TaxID=1690604 RepID=A0AAN7TBD9_9EURO|nr:hypothetical protein LTR05_000603 [Lithohypha guttulata]